MSSPSTMKARHANPIPGDRAGHNLNAPAHGLATDATLSQSPGGNYPAASMGCSSCHDPHGTSDFRMLYGAGRVVYQGNYTFVNPTPIAVGLSVSDNSQETNSSHTAYQSGVSDWCANCHGDFHVQDMEPHLRHPAGEELGAEISNNYNLYNGTDNITGGTQATAYLAQVPFEDPSNTTTSTSGPGVASKVMCLTCHRAHGSSGPSSGRWDFNVTFLSDDGVASGSYALANPYNSVNQRSLCNKCHVKDQYDRPKQ